MHYVENIILKKEAFEIRPFLLGTLMFDEFTSSNAEAEHSSLKRPSLGVLHHISMTTLFQKTKQDSARKTNERLQLQAKDLDMTDTMTKCFMSNYLVQKCFEAIKKRIELSKQCVSKQIDSKNWIVVFNRHKQVNRDHFKHFLPNIQRKRFVTLTKGMFMVQKIE